jgi:hypothetical protein
MRALLLGVVACSSAAAAPATSPPGVVAYDQPARCFDSKLDVYINRDFDDGGNRAELTFTLDGKSHRSSVPIPIGEQIHKAKQPLHMCAVAHTDGADPLMILVEIWAGKTSLWHSSYDFPVEQTLAWSSDGKLLVELGRAMDDVYATPYHHAGVVPVTVPGAHPTGKHRVVVHLDEHEAGATVTFVEIQ